jgi:hypothetical protein
MVLDCGRSPEEGETTMSLSHISTSLTEVVPRAPTGGVRTLHDLVSVFEGLEAQEYPDTIVELKQLRMTTEESIAIPNLGNFALTDWARKQLASLLGIQWQKWFQTTSHEEQADEINRRLWRKGTNMRLRTSRLAVVSNGTAGILRAIVTPTFSPVDDVMLSRRLVGLLAPAEPELPIMRINITDRSVTYMVAVGKPFKHGDDKVVGDVWGGLLIRNSGVGFASLAISLSLVRLICLNGMSAPIPDAVLLRRSHRGITDERLLDALTKTLRELPGKISEGARVLTQARGHHIQASEQEFIRVLELAHMPRRLLPDLQSAYALEPEPSMFGISQAVTRASQKLSPEERFELDRAAGTYLQQNASAN